MKRLFWLSFCMLFAALLNSSTIIGMMELQKTMFRQAFQLGEVDIARQIVAENRAILADPDVAKEIWLQQDFSPKQIEIVELCLQNGLDPNRPFGDAGIFFRPIEMAIFQAGLFRSFSLLSLLIKPQYKLDVNVELADGLIPLNKVGDLGAVNALRILVDEGRANVEKKNKHGQTPMQYFAEKAFQAPQNLRLVIMLGVRGVAIPDDTLAGMEKLFGASVLPISLHAMIAEELSISSFRPEGQLHLLKSYLKFFKGYKFPDGDSVSDKYLKRLLTQKVEHVSWFQALSTIFDYSANLYKYIGYIFLFEDTQVASILKIMLMPERNFDVTRIVQDQLLPLLVYEKVKTLQLLKDHKVDFGGLQTKVDRLLARQRFFAPIVQHARQQVELKKRFEELQEHKKVAAERVEPAQKRFTQLEAYLGFVHKDPNPRINFEALVKKTLTERFPADHQHEAFRVADQTPYVEMLKNLNERARERLATHYSVVHAQNVSAYLIVQLATVLTERFSMFAGKGLKLRMGTTVKQKTMSEFLQYGYSRFPGTGPGERLEGRWSDHSIGLGPQLLSVNFSFFGGIFGGENTAEYFVLASSNIDHTRLIASVIFDPLFFDHKYIPKILSIVGAYMGRGLDRSLIQIFLRKQSTAAKKGINDFVYVSEPYGTPHRMPIDGKLYVNKDATGKYSVDTAAYLEKYITDLKSLGDFPFPHPLSSPGYRQSNRHCLEGRVVLFPDMYDHAEMFHYNFMSKDDKAAFKKDLEQVVDEAIKEWIVTEKYKKLLGDPHYGRLAKLVDLHVEGQKVRHGLAESLQQQPKIFASIRGETLAEATNNFIVVRGWIARQPGALQDDYRMQTLRKYDSVVGPIAEKVFRSLRAVESWADRLAKRAQGSSAADVPKLRERLGRYVARYKKAISQLEPLKKVVKSKVRAQADKINRQVIRTIRIADGAISQIR